MHHWGEVCAYHSVEYVQVVLEEVEGHTEDTCACIGGLRSIRSQDPFGVHER